MRLVGLLSVSLSFDLLDAVRYLGGYVYACVRWSIGLSAGLHKNY